jgi:hypothetical protein
MRFGSYRVSTFQLGSNNPTPLAASRQQGVVCLKIPGQFERSNQTFARSKLRTNLRASSYGISQLTKGGQELCAIHLPQDF